MRNIPTITGIWQTLRRVKQQIDDDRVLAVSAGVTFYVVLAMIPALTALISLFGLVSAPQDVPGQLTSLTGIMPVEAATLLTEQATRIAAKPSGALSLTALIAIGIAVWSANGGTKALIEALGIAYGVKETRGFVRLNLVSLGFTFGGLLFAVVLGGLVAALPLILEWLMRGQSAETVILWGRWPIVIAVLLSVLALLYRLGPDWPSVQKAWITPGAVVAALGLIVTSSALGWYVSNFGSYDETYGSLAAVVVLMLWVWLSTIVVLIGAEINAELDRKSGVSHVGQDGMRKVEPSLT